MQRSCSRAPVRRLVLQTSKILAAQACTNSEVLFSLVCVFIPELGSRDKPWPCTPSCFLSAAAPKVPPCPVRQEAHASRQVRLDTPLLTARGSGRNDKMVRYAGACTWRCVCVRACRLRVPEFARACACMHACLHVCRSDGLRVCVYLLVNSV